MDLAVERVDLHCLVEAAGLAVPLQLVEETGLAGSQHSVEEAGLVGSAMVVGILLVEQSCSLRPPHNIPEGILTPTIICLNMLRKAL
jgi:hypothetical protein